MSERCRQLSDRDYAAHIGQVGLGLTQSLALFLPALALREVEHESQGLAPAVPNHRGSEQHGYAAAVAAEVLLFKDFAGASRSELRFRSIGYGLPYARSQLCPSASLDSDFYT